MRGNVCVVEFHEWFSNIHARKIICAKGGDLIAARVDGLGGYRWGHQVILAAAFHTTPVNQNGHMYPFEFFFFL